MWDGAQLLRVSGEVVENEFDQSQHTLSNAENGHIHRASRHGLHVNCATQCRNVMHDRIQYPAPVLLIAERKQEAKEAEKNRERSGVPVNSMQTQLEMTQSNRTYTMKQI